MLNPEVYNKVIVKAWSDPQFKDQLLKNPEKILREQGIEIPEGVKVTVCENTDQQFFLVLPAKLSTELTEEQLETIAAGGVFSDLVKEYIEGRGGWKNVFDSVRNLLK